MKEVATKPIQFPTADRVLDNLLDEGLGHDFEGMGLSLDEVQIEADSILVSRTLGEIVALCLHGCVVVGVRRQNGRSITRPAVSTKLSAGDVVVVAGFQDDIFTNVP